MTKEKCKKVLDAIGLPRLIVFLFFLAIVITAAVNGIDVASYFSSTLKYWGMWGILVLAMVPSIKCGIGPNFGVSLGIVCGLLGALLAIQFNVAPAVNGALRHGDRRCHCLVCGRGIRQAAEPGEGQRNDRHHLHRLLRDLPDVHSLVPGSLLQRRDHLAFGRCGCS